ncbi:MAG TPA: hypothetical protein VJR89_23980, partial [Polyangiales bacterium]|nr:hypothetical protein [Polyangiales bacterium]
MRFFVYISDAKVDGLLAEMPALDRAQVASELAVDPAWLDIEQLPSGAPDDLRFARAEAAARAL